MADNKDFKPKYVARVKIGKDKYRYFYTQAEYQAYLKGEDSAKEDTSSKTETKKAETKTTKKSVLSGLFGGLKKAASNISKTVKKVSNSLVATVQKGSSAVEKSLKKTGDTSVDKVASSGATKTGEKIVTDLIKKSDPSVDKAAEYGKTATDTALKKIGDKSTKSPDVVTKVSKGLKAIGSALGKLFNKAVSTVKNVVTDVVNAIESLVSKKKPEKESNKNGGNAITEDAITEDIITEDVITEDVIVEDVIDERRSNLSEEYNEWLDSKPPKSFDELQMKDNHVSSPDSWDGVWDDALDVNENYIEATSLVPPDVAATENCSYCTAAYDLRQRGYDVEAAPYDPNDPPTNIYELMSWYDNPDPYTISYNPNNLYDVNNASGKILDALLEQGNGARGNFCAYWANGGGHSVAYEVRNDEVYLIDCQTQQLFTVYDLVRYSSTVTYFRTDNIKPNEKILNKVRNDDD